MKVRREREARANAIKTAEDELRMVGDFVCLIDTMQVQAMLIHTVLTLQHFAAVIEELAETQQRNKALFEINLQFGPGSTTTFDPTLDEVKQTVQMACDSIMLTLGAVPRVIQSNALKSYLHGRPCHHSHVSNLVKKDLTYQKICRNMGATLDGNWTVIQEYARGHALHYSLPLTIQSRFCSHFSHYSLCANHSLFAILTHYFLGFESFRNIFDAHETWSVAAFAAKRPGFVLFRCGSLLVAHYWVRLTMGSGLN